MMFFVMMACAPEDTVEKSLFGITLEEYHMMSESNSWTYRDDMPVSSDLLPDEAQLMLAQNDVGTMNFRRGSRWIEATPTGSIEWSLDDGLSLVSWDLPGLSGSGPIALSSAEPEDGDTISEGDWTCALTRPESMWTWYAEFDDVLYFECFSATETFDIFFGKRAGLIRFSNMEYELDLVAPW